MKRIIVAVCLHHLLPWPAVSSVFAAPQAYIDPNTGGMLAQALIVVLGMLTGVCSFLPTTSKCSSSALRASLKTESNEPVAQEVVTPETPQENQVH